MGTFSDEKVYGIRWVSVDNEKVKYEKIFSKEITTEQIQQIYDDFMRLVPEKDRLLTYKYYVYVHFCYTLGRVSKYFMTWYPIKPHDAIHYFRFHKISL